MEEKPEEEKRRMAKVMRKVEKEIRAKGLIIF